MIIELRSKVVGDRFTWDSCKIQNTKCLWRGFTASESLGKGATKSLERIHRSRG